MLGGDEFPPDIWSFITDNSNQVLQNAVEGWQGQTEQDPDQDVDGCIRVVADSPYQAS